MRCCNCKDILTAENATTPGQYSICDHCIDMQDLDEEERKFVAKIRDCMACKHSDACPLDPHQCPRFEAR